MKIKKSIIMLMLVIFLFSLTSVCAGEMDDAMASDDTDQIVLSSNDGIAEDNLKTGDEKVTLAESDDSAESDVSLKSSEGDVLSSSGNFGELQKLIDDASENSEINLERNYTYAVGTDTITNGITISKSLTINGNGFTIDAQGKSRIFNIASEITVALNNITFINGYVDGDGGAVYFGGSGEILNCNFINNNVTGLYGSGGAVEFTGEGKVTNCNFTNNTAAYYGSAVHFSQKGEVTKCNFTGNKAIGNMMTSAGAVVFENEGKLTNCTFTDNCAGDGAGAVRMVGSGTIINCNFTNNTA
ncbi:MAG: hypothetical protein UHW60_09755, partial [Methanobrevibacter sp.]|nr:hypothetical protein [Methanobrevibacter sp.]